jgi:hypothetical protein
MHKLFAKAFLQFGWRARIIQASLMIALPSRKTRIAVVAHCYPYFFYINNE